MPASGSEQRGTGRKPEKGKREAGLTPEKDKTISHVRLKRPVARWYVEKANHMLALRCSKYNGTFQKLFQRYAREPRKRRMYKRSKNG